MQKIDIPSSFSSEEELFTCLARHTEFLPFVSIFVDSTDEIRSGEDQLRHLEMLGRLSNFFNLDMLMRKPKKTRETPDFSALTGYHQRIYRMLVFIEQKMHKVKEMQFKTSTAFLKSLLDFITAIPDSFQSISMVVNEEKLYNFLLKDARILLAYQSFYNFRYSLISRLATTLQTYDANIFEMKRIIEIMSLNIKDDVCYFPQHPLQPTFERVIMSPLLPYAKDIEAIIDGFSTLSPEQFVAQIFEEVALILDDLQFTEKRHDMALILLLYRFIFDNAYEKNPYLQGQSKDIISRLRYMPLRNLQLPKDYCPEFDETLGAESLFKNDPLYRKSIEALELCVYYTNPFDILHCVDEAIYFLEVAASSHSSNPQTIFPFEVTFTLFMGVLLSTSLTNWLNIVSFVLKYTPQTGLDTKFEYARAKMEASKVECLNMIGDLNENTIPEQAYGKETPCKVAFFAY